ncbi:MULTISPECIES: hypothetical protein [unclassified Acidovorax]|uniref:hypothetical protein n=1 Tax=unclassified Acidovorax TaxID=2684926 RepID=UPI00288311A6|nr:MULTISPECIES: hypothetical protein [unclassified Acidovorax]
MPYWTPFSSAADYAFSPEKLSAAWLQLHAGDAEPYPNDAGALQAWGLFHAGHFQQAEQAGLVAGGAGTTAANKATIVYALYLERSESRRLELLELAAERSRRQALADPHNANAWFWHAYALGRYAQRISVTKALAEGLGARVRDTLTQVIALEPRHADARIALGAFHAEVIDKVGPLVAGLTFSARKDQGLRLFEEALAHNPASIIGKIEYAKALIMLEGDARSGEAMQLYKAASCAMPQDAAEHLAVNLAQRKWEHHLATSTLDEGN